MRENMGLYRGKRKDTGEWVVGYLLKTKWAETGQEIIAIIPQKNCIYFNSISEWVGVDPETVGQFIGVTDKNGNKIFEGDVIRCESMVLAVKFCGASFCYVRCGTVYPIDDSETGIYEQIGNEYEVIGNIHDNPELLRKED